MNGTQQKGKSHLRTWMYTSQERVTLHCLYSGPMDVLDWVFNYLSILTKEFQWDYRVAPVDPGVELHLIIWNNSQGCAELVHLYLKQKSFVRPPQNIKEWGHTWGLMCSVYWEWVVVVSCFKKSIFSVSAASRWMLLVLESLTQLVRGFKQTAE